MTLVDATYKQPSVTSLCFCHCPHKRRLQSSCLLHCSVRVNWTVTRNNGTQIGSQHSFDVTIPRLRYLPFSFMWSPRDQLNDQQQEQLLALLRASAWVPSAVDTSTLGVDA